MERRRDPRDEAGALGDGIAGGRGGGARGGKNRNRGKPQKQLAQNSKATPTAFGICVYAKRMTAFYRFRLKFSFGVQTNSIQTNV